MTARRGYGRAAWVAPAATPPEIADAVHRIVDLWAERVEAARVRRGMGFQPVTHGQDAHATPRFDHTTRRCRAVAAVLRGLAGRQQIGEADLADAIEAYAASDWHRKQRAWRTLTDWLAPEREDELLRWVTDGRAGRHRRELAVEARAVRASQVGPGERAGALAAAAEAELAALERAASDRLEGIERAVLDGLDDPTRRALWTAAGRPGGPLTIRNSRGLRGLVLRRIAADLQAAGRGGGGYAPPAVGDLLPPIAPDPPHRGAAP